MDYFSSVSNFSDLVGMLGVVLILIAYGLLSIDRWRSDSFIYQFLNFIGAWFILFSLYFHWNTASVVIEVAWIIISMVGLYRAIGHNKHKLCNGQSK